MGMRAEGAIVLMPVMLVGNDCHIIVNLYR
jgi:hypothetical protein